MHETEASFTKQCVPLYMLCGLFLFLTPWCCLDPFTWPYDSLVGMQWITRTHSLNASSLWLPPSYTAKGLDTRNNSPGRTFFLFSLSEAYFLCSNVFSQDKLLSWRWTAVMSIPFWIDQAHPKGVTPPHRVQAEEWSWCQCLMGSEDSVLL